MLLHRTYIDVVTFRRRTVIEEELEMLYDAYYEELEHYEDENSIAEMEDTTGNSSSWNGNANTKNTMKKRANSNGPAVNTSKTTQNPNLLSKNVTVATTKNISDSNTPNSGFNVSQISRISSIIDHTMIIV